MAAADETAWLCDHFNRMLSAPTPEELTAYLLAHPVLLSRSAQRLIQLAGPHQPMAEAALEFLDATRNYFSSHLDEYPAGHAPLERVIASLRDGELDLPEAIDRAKAAECAGQLSQTYLLALVLRLEAEVDADVTFAMGAAELALESAVAMPWPTLAHDVRPVAAEGFIRLVHRGLMRRPDGRLFARAFAIGDWAWRDAEARGNLPLKAAYLHWLGTLALDAYCANFAPSPEFPSYIESWLAKAVEPMPSAIDGLARAHQHLAAAIDLRPAGRERGVTLKALVETMVYEGYARGAKPDPRKISALADRALENLDPEEDENTIKRLLALRRLSEGS